MKHRKPIYLIAGHNIINGVGTGASSYLGDEAIENSRMVRSVSKELIRKGEFVVTDNDNWGLKKVVSWVKKMIKKESISIDFPPLYIISCMFKRSY